MYEPKGNGRDKAVDLVRFIETEPPECFTGIVHRFLELKTETPLLEDYRFHALPDVCSYAVFDQMDTRIAGVTRLNTTSEELNLGKEFHFVNIRFMPGVWQCDPEEIAYGVVDRPYSGNWPLVEVNRKLASADDFAAKQSILSDLVQWLVDEKLVAVNEMTLKILTRIDDIHTVADMAAVVNLSPRQLQRTLKRMTGFAPRDFLKVLRLQQSLDGNYSLSYTDQSHFIHSFRKATGYTPGKYARKYDV